MCCSLGSGQQKPKYERLLVRLSQKKASQEFTIFVDKALGFIEKQTLGKKPEFERYVGDMLDIVSHKKQPKQNREALYSYIAILLRKHNGEDILLPLENSMILEDAVEHHNMIA